MAGRLRTPSKSLMHDLRRLISAAVCSISNYVVRSSMGALVLCSVAFAQLAQELIRRNEEGVLLERSADDNHRMRPHDVDNDFPAKLGEMVRSSDRIAVPRQQVVQPRLVLEQVVDARAILQCPFHVGDQPGQWEMLFSAVFEDV